MQPKFRDERKYLLLFLTYGNRLRSTDRREFLLETMQTYFVRNFFAVRNTDI
mgnify:CR=1 FL=1